MRGSIVPLALFALAFCGVAAAAPPPSDGPLAFTTATQCLSEGPDVGAAWSADFAPGTVVEAEPSSPAPPPPCPVERNCTGPAGNGNTCSTNPANCQATGFGTITDTGNRACTLPDGSIFKCTGHSTIIIKSANCSHCPCCSQTPACLCPLDCGSVVRWGCG